LLLTYTPILLFCLSCKIDVPVSVQRLLEAAGNMTYSSYLVHFPVQLLVALGFALCANPIPFYEAWFFVMFVTSTLLISYLTYRYFEAPAQTLLRHYLLRDAKMGPGLGAAALTGHAGPSKTR
jgi:peptidoglycan/LPS O-acetylase OafA/YrhL